MKPEIEMVQKNGMELAVEAAGGQRALHRLTGISLSFISKMYLRGWAAPTQAQLISAKTGVPCELLNPKVFKKVSPEV